LEASRPHCPATHSGLVRDETRWSNKFDPTNKLNQTRLNRRTAHDETRWSNDFDPTNKLNQTRLKTIIVGPNSFGQQELQHQRQEYFAIKSQTPEVYVQGSTHQY
jgi:hypothetical protein